jgi:hypothetical protein
MTKISDEEELLAVIRKRHEAVIGAMRTCAEAVRAVSPKLAFVQASVTGNLPKPPSIGVLFEDKRPRPEDAVASAYDFAERLLASERKFVEDLLKAIAPLMPVRADSAPEGIGQLPPRLPSEGAPQARAAASKPKGDGLDAPGSAPTPANETYRPGRIVPRDGTVECTRHHDVQDQVKAGTRFAPCSHHHEHSKGCTWQYV